MNKAFYYNTIIILLIVIIIFLCFNLFTNKTNKNIKEENNNNSKEVKIAEINNRITPNCDNELTLNEIKDYVQYNLFKNSTDIEFFIDLPRTISYDPNIDKYTCSAIIEVNYPHKKYTENFLNNKKCYIEKEECKINYSIETSQNAPLYSFSDLYGCKKEYGTCFEETPKSIKQMMNAYNSI